MQGRTWMALVLACTGLEVRAQTVVLSLATSAVTVSEDGGSGAVSVRRTGDSNTVVSVNFSVAGMTATAGADFLAHAGTLVFNPGEVTKPIPVAVLDDGWLAGEETARVTLSQPVDAVLGAIATATMTIRDNEVPSVVDGAFDPGLGADGDVFDLAVQPDGKVIIGGEFWSFNGTACPGIARLHPDGSLDRSFDIGAGADDTVWALAWQPDGKIVMGGAFTTVNGVARNGVARLNADGSLDTGFDPGLGANDELRALAVQPDGKIVMGGRFTAVAGQARNRIARLNGDGSLDTTFDPGAGANNHVRTLRLQPDGRVLISGTFTLVANQPRNRLARLHADGSLDAGFASHSGANDQVRALALTPDGRIYIGGDFEIYAGTERSAVARLFSDGQLDPSFDPGDPANDTVRVVVPDGTGGVWVGGEFLIARGTGSLLYCLARLLSDGRPNPGFFLETTPDDEVFGIALLDGGTALVAGQFWTVNGTPRRHIARIFTDPTRPTVGFAAGSQSVSEGAGLVSLTLIRGGHTTNSLTVEVSTSDLTATAGVDYLGTNLTLLLPPGLVSTQVSIPILNDNLPEPEKSFVVRARSTAAAAGPYPDITVQIADNDTGILFLAGNTVALEAAGVAVVEVLRLDGVVGPATVEFFTADGTARAGLDYTGTNGVLHFAAGETNQSLRIPLEVDALAEGEEWFTLALTNALGDVLGTQTVTTVVVDDRPRTVEFMATAATTGEGNPSPSACLWLQRFGPTNVPTAVQYTITPGTARPGEDFTGPLTGTVVIGTGLDGLALQYGRFCIPIVRDGEVEGDETLIVTLSNLSPGQDIGTNHTAVLTILDNDRGFEFVATNVIAFEDAGLASLAVRRGDDALETATVEYAAFTGSATPGLDYIPAVGTLTFPPGQATQTFSLVLMDDCLVENEETVVLTLANPSGRLGLGAANTALLTLRDSGVGQAGSRDYGFRNTDHRGVFARQPDGKVLVGDAYNLTLVRLHPDGTLDSSFDAREFTERMRFYNLGGRMTGLVPQTDGKVLLSGYAFGPDGIPGNYIVRLLPHGLLDPSFTVTSDNWAGPGPIHALALQPDGRIVVSGPFDELNGQSCNGLVRLLPDGATDPTFNPPGGVNPLHWAGPVAQIVVQPDGKLILGGRFTNIAGANLLGIARLNPDGSLDTNFNPGTGATYTDQLGTHPSVLAVALQPDGRILIGGDFTSVNGVPRVSLARLLPEGAVDPSFDPGAGATAPDRNEVVTSLAVQWDGKILLAGRFTRVGGVDRTGVARLTASGALDLSFDAGANWGYPGPSQVAVQPDGRLLVGGLGQIVSRYYGEPPLHFTAVARPAPHAVSLTAEALPGRDYALESSSNLVDWIVAETHRATNCQVQFTVATPSQAGPWFFRLIRLSP